jgi:uncharacterized RDD family membrane protein YckC
VEAPVQRVASEVVELVVDSLDLDELLARVDLDTLLARVDLNALVAQVDVDALLDRVDLDRLLDRVDVDRLLDRVDVERLLDRVDADALVGRVDVNEIVTRVDVDGLIAQTELGAIVAKSTSGVVTEVLDVARSQGVGLDALTMRWVNRLLKRRPDTMPAGPGLLVAEEAAGPAAVTDATAPDRDVSLQGHYAGGVTRLAAYAVDAAASTAIFSTSVAAFAYAVGMVTGRDFELSNHPVIGAGLALLWYFLWFWYPWSVSGRSLGMAVVGLRVVQSDGTALPARRAFVRTVTLPLSFLVFGLGFLGILVDRRHRAWHDHFAGTAVVYAWDARIARLRFLAKQEPPPS